MAQDAETKPSDGSQVKSAAELLATPAQFLKGVGPHRAPLLARLELKTARDILFHFPRDYQDMSELRTIDQLEENQPVSVSGHVEEIDLRNTGIGRSRLGVLVRQGKGKNAIVHQLWLEGWNYCTCTPALAGKIEL